MASARGPRKPTISSLAATRMQKRRSRWGHLQTRRWTKEEFRELLGHIQALGYDWVAIANIMGRSPDSLRNKLVRFHRSSIWKKREEARAWLKAVVLVLELKNRRTGDGRTRRISWKWTTFPLPRSGIESRVKKTQLFFLRTL